MLTQQVLITKSDFTDIVYLTKNLDFDIKIKPFAITAQELEMSDWLGSEFMQAIVNKPQDYLELLDGEVYQNGDRSYTFTGIRKIIVYITASRMVWGLSTQLTETGMMFKNNEYSSHASDGSVGRQSKEYMSLANSYWDKAVDYLNAKVDKYPLWRSNCRCSEPNRSGRPRMTSVGSSDNHYNYERWQLIRR